MQCSYRKWMQKGWKYSISCNGTWVWSSCTVCKVSHFWSKEQRNEEYDNAASCKKEWRCRLSGYNGNRTLDGCRATAWVCVSFCAAPVTQWVIRPTRFLPWVCPSGFLLRPRQWDPFSPCLSVSFLCLITSWAILTARHGIFASCSKPLTNNIFVRANMKLETPRHGGSNKRGVSRQKLHKVGQRTL